MKKRQIPHTYAIIFYLILFCALLTWIIPGGQPQSWQVCSAVYKGFVEKADSMGFILSNGGADWIVNAG